MLGGYACPTDAAIRDGGPSGVVEVLEEGRGGCECECADLGGGLVAVLVTILAV